MRLARLAVFVIGVGSALVVWGCGSKSRTQAHGTERQVPSALDPTPDTTPVAALRTPAGLVLKLEAAPAVTPTPPPGAATESRKAAP